MSIACPIPARPAVVTVCTTEADGSHRKRANMIVDESQMPQLLAASPLRDHTLRSLAAALGLMHLPITLQRAAVAAPVILAS